MLFSFVVNNTVILWTGFIVGLALLLSGITIAVYYYQEPKPPLSPEEIEAEKERKLLEQKEKERIKAEQKYLREVRYYAKVMANKLEESLTQQKKVHIERVQTYKGRSSRKMKTVKIHTVMYSHDTVYLHISKRPFGIDWQDVMNERVLENISIDIGYSQIRWCNWSSKRDVHGHSLGVWLEVFLDSSIAGIPPYVDYIHEGKPIVEYLPQKRRFALPAGIGANRNLVWFDMASTSNGPSLLIAGTTGSGKSQALKAFITIFLMRNSPKHLRTVFVDLKRIELNRFRDIPHNLMPIAKDLETAKNSIEFVHVEMNKRYKMLEERDAENIDVWFSLTGERLPRILLCIDELILLSRTKEDQLYIQELLIDLMALGRAAGIILFMATQYPNKDVLSGLMRANISTKLVGWLDQYASVNTVGTRDAYHIENIAGRFLYQFSSTTREVQMFEMKRGVIDKVLSEMVYVDTEHGAILTALKYCVENRKGKASKNHLERELSGQVVIAKLKEALIKYTYDFEEKNIIPYDGRYYILAKVKPPKQHQTRWFLEVDPDNLPKDQSEIEKLFEQITKD